MNHLRQLLLAFLLLGILVTSLIQTVVHAADVSVKLPLIDAPFNWSNGYSFPSMQQSLGLTKGFYDYTHQRIVQAFSDKPKAELWTTLGFDVVSLWLPLGSGWLHEEWHRAVMSHRGIHSYDEIYDFNLFSETVSVSHVTDLDLIQLKKQYPADLVRLHAAGMEAQNELNRAIEQDIFFKGRQSFVDALLLLNDLNNSSYLYTCASNDSNRLTQDMLNSEGSDTSKRDFTGLDCDAWVYDLFRPDEPYTARGIHPSGTGIKRYIAYDDLTGSEKDYLNKQLVLSLLNLINPMYLHYDRFNATNPFINAPFEWNAALRHYLTSFGYSVDINLWMQQAQHNLSLTLHNYVNHHHYFPGVSLVLLRLPFSAWNKRFWLTPSLDLWLQPQQQQFETASGKLGGRLSLELERPLNQRFDSFIAVDAKSDGWVAGNEYLGKNISVRVGLIAHIH